MNYHNYATRLRIDLCIRMLHAYFDGKLIEKIDRIPLDMRPRGGEHARCCIYRDRAIIRQRCISVLGFGTGPEEDELTPLADYARRALERTLIEGPVLHVIEEGCSSCIRSRYEVTNACRGCLARPCMLNCPRRAIRIVQGHADIDPALCVNCGKCLGECPFHAIIRIPIPCEEACPVDAITKDEQGRAVIHFEKCIFCGKCMKACPFGAIMEKSQLFDVPQQIRRGCRVVAMVAPSIIGQFPGSLGQIAAGLEKLGFCAVVEVAHGADMTARHEAAEFTERMARGDACMTSSCCPAYTDLVKKHVAGLAPFVSSAATPMHAMGAWVKQQFDPQARTVFIGPCFAKRHEALFDSCVDYVMTFEELGALLVAREIDVAALDAVDVEPAGRREGRGFAVSGGVTRAVAGLLADGAGAPLVVPALVDGLSKKTIALLKTVARERQPGNFIEVMACEGGCVSGPGVVAPGAAAVRQLEKFLENSQAIRNGCADQHSHAQR